jgi:hypothetical protein
MTHEKNMGFKNCPSVAEFRVGMRVREVAERYTGGWFTVAIVLCDGSPVDEFGKKYPWPCYRKISDFELDLDSIWVGREYRRKDSPTIPVSVRAVSESHIGFCEGYYDEVSSCWTRDEFLYNYESVPLPPEPPVKVGDVVCVKTAGGKEYIGRVLSVEPEGRHFVIREGGGQRGLVWGDGSIITRLVPFQEVENP